MLTHRTIEVQGSKLKKGDRVLVDGNVKKLEWREVGIRYRFISLPFLVGPRGLTMVVKPTKSYDKLKKKWWFFWWPF